MQYIGSYPPPPPRHTHTPRGARSSLICTPTITIRVNTDDPSHMKQLYEAHVCLLSFLRLKNVLGLTLQKPVQELRTTGI